jgi:hypothetical protein
VLPVLDLDGSPRVLRAQAQLLDVGAGGWLLIHEEEVPREGMVVQRAYQSARWHDGRLFVWAGRRSSVGRREASSALSFDELERQPADGTSGAPNQRAQPVTRSRRR